MLRWTRQPVVTPPYAGRAAASCCPSGALMLAPGPDRRPGLRPRLRATLPRRRRAPARAGSERARAPRRRARRSTCTSTPPAGSRSAASSAPSTSRTGPPAATTGRSSRTRASTPSRSPSSPTGWPRWQLNPAPILLVHRGPARSARVCTRLLAGPPDSRYTDRADQRHRIWAIPDPEAHRRRSTRPWSTSARADRRRPPPVRRLPPAPGSSTPAARRTAALAMLVDQADTPLFLGAIHRVLAGLDARRPRAAAAARGGRLRAASRRHEAVAALARDVLVATDGEHWATLRLHGRRATAPRSRCCTRPAAGAGPHATGRIGYHHSVEEALAAPRRTGVAVLLPAPTSTWCSGSSPPAGCCPRRPPPSSPSRSLGVLIRSLRDG